MMFEIIMFEIMMLATMMLEMMVMPAGARSSAAERCQFGLHTATGRDDRRIAVAIENGSGGDQNRVRGRSTAGHRYRSRMRRSVRDRVRTRRGDS